MNQLNIHKKQIQSQLKQQLMAVINFRKMFEGLQNLSTKYKIQDQPKYLAHPLDSATLTWLSSLTQNLSKYLYSSLDQVLVGFAQSLSGKPQEAQAMTEEFQTLKTSVLQENRKLVTGFQTYPLPKDTQDECIKRIEDHIYQVFFKNEPMEPDQDLEFERKTLYSTKRHILQEYGDEQSVNPSHYFGDYYQGVSPYSPVKYVSKTSILKKSKRISPRKWKIAKVVKIKEVKKEPFSVKSFVKGLRIELIEPELEELDFYGLVRKPKKLLF